MIKSRKQMFVVIGAFALVSMLGTVTYAFFNYTRTGAANTIRVGRISFVSKNEQTISLSNLFPIDPSNTTDMNDNTKVGTYSIDIEGDTDYVDGIEYLVSITNANIYTSTGKTVPISINVTTEDLGSPNANYFTARESKDTLMYKKIIGDTIVGDGMLLVGYIPQNNPTGTADGIDGSITIKAYLDENKILISDTYDGTESDNMGTPNSLAQGKTVLTRSEWNSLQSSGLSFKVKVEANEGIWVNGSLEEIMKQENLGVDTEQGVDFSKTSTEDETKGVYLRAGTQNDAYPIMYYRGAVEDNNVLFANKCWKTVRTTDTGGVKLIYNGEYTEQNKCNNTGTATHISVDVNGTPKNSFAFNTNSNSPAYEGYMYGTVYEYKQKNSSSTFKFGTGFTYNNGTYTLTSAENGIASTRQYTCFTSSEICDGTDLGKIYYVYYKSGNYYFYIELENGKSVEDALADMQTNTVNSNAKENIEDWYEANMTSYTSKIEDTIYCNDRSMNTQTNGWVANGGSLSEYLYYAPYGRAYTTYSPSLSCTNKNDSFTWKNGNGNQKLEYPVGMLTSDEIMLAGGKGGSTNGEFYLNTGAHWWSLSPYSFDYSSAREFYVHYYGDLNNYLVRNSIGLRPVVSLKHGTPVVSGSGTAVDPYVIG